MKHIQGAVMFVLCLPAVAPCAQDTKQDPRAALLRAVVIEEQEHDLASAIAEYTRLAQDAQLPAAVRAEAKLRLGLAQLRSGREAEGKATLLAVVEVGGEVGERARKVLAGSEASADEMRARIERALALFQVDQGTGSEELKFLGAPAAPVLAARMLDAERPFSRELLQAATPLLLALDAQVAADTLVALSKRDAYVRRAVAAGLRFTGVAKADAVVASYLRDVDADVRVEAVKSIGAQAKVDDLAASVADGSEKVRGVLFEILEVIAGGLDPGGERTETLLDLFSAEHARQAPVMPFWRALQHAVFLQRGKGMSLALRALRHPSCPWGGQPSFSTQLKPNECIEEAVATAEALVNAGEDRRQRLRGLVFACEPHWDRAVLPARIRLQALGYGNLPAWLKQHGTAEDLPIVLDNLSAFLLDGGFFEWLRTQPIPATRWRAFADHAEIKARADSTSTMNDVYIATWFAVRTGHTDALAWVQRFAPSHPSAYSAAAQALREYGNRDTAEAALIALLSAEVPPAKPNSGVDIGNAREQLIGMAIYWGMDRAADAIVRAHTLLPPDRQGRIFSTLGSQGGQGPSALPSPSCSSAHKTRLTRRVTR
jgi:hypothetical protein